MWMVAVNRLLVSVLVRSMRDRESVHGYLLAMTAGFRLEG